MLYELISMYLNFYNYMNAVDRTTECNATVELDTIFKYLSSLENDIVRPRTLSFMGRNVTFQKCCGQVLDSSFAELCDRVRDFNLHLSGIRLCHQLSALLTIISAVGCKRLSTALSSISYHYNKEHTAA